MKHTISIDSFEFYSHQETLAQSTNDHNKRLIMVVNILEGKILPVAYLVFFDDVVNETAYSGLILSDAIVAYNKI